MNQLDVNNTKIGFVILHYLALEDTVRCVTSIIEKIDTNNYEIVIVDNASSNNSGKVLVDKYKSNEKIHVILNTENGGFSKGNNIGFKIAKELKCDFICMMNNDTYLIQEDYFKVILDEYSDSHYAVMGPEIWLPNNHVEEVLHNMITLEEVKKQIKELNKKLLLNYTFIESINIVSRNIVKKLIGYKSKSTYRTNREGRLEDVVLHGCCWIFSPIYINKFDGLNEVTFLYKEEELLYLRLKENNMLSVYNPKLKIFHNEDASTNMLTKKGYKKRRFVYKYGKIACIKLLEEMNK